MLVDPPPQNLTKELQEMLDIVGDGPSPGRIACGLYELTHFNLDLVLDLSGYQGYFKSIPDVPNTEDGLSSYGVVDSIEQFRERYEKPLQLDTKFAYVVYFTQISRAHEPARGGWRWRKWGPYLGTKEPTTEYLYDEPDIDSVHVYGIYRKELT